MYVVNHLGRSLEVDISEEGMDLLIINTMSDSAESVWLDWDEIQRLYAYMHEEIWRKVMSR